MDVTDPAVDVTDPAVDVEAVDDLFSGLGLKNLDAGIMVETVTFLDAEKP